MERPTIKFRRRGIKPETSEIYSILNECPNPNCDAENDKLRLDESRAEISCTVCGYVIADSVDYIHSDKEFLMIIEKEP